MKASVLTLLLLAVLVLGLSFPVAAEDDPESLYDESEQLPYENTPHLQLEALRQPLRIGQAPAKLGSLIGLRSVSKSDEEAVNKETASGTLVSESPTILGHSFRC